MTNTMIVVFCYSEHPISKIIRIRQGFKHSHVAIFNPHNHHIIEAHGGHLGDGYVRQIPVTQFAKLYTEYEIRVVRGNYKIAYEHLGEGFDKYGAIGNCFRVANKTEDPNKWFCSELVALCMEDSNKDMLYNVSPFDIYKFSQNPSENILKHFPSEMLQKSPT